MSFVLDTTGSMSALLDGAKRKIWEIARFIAQARPAPELRIGLVAYRDVGDEYVTRFFDRLTTWMACIRTSPPFMPGRRRHARARLQGAARCRLPHQLVEQQECPQAGVPGR